MDIRNGFAPAQPRNGNWRVEIVKDPKHIGRPNRLRSYYSVRTIGGNESDIGVTKLTLDPGPCLQPVLIYMEPSARQMAQIAISRIIRNVPLKKGDVVPTADQFPYQAAPDGRVPIAPGRTDCEPKDYNLHDGRLPFGFVPGRSLGRGFAGTPSRIFVRFPFSFRFRLPLFFLAEAHKPPSNEKLTLFLPQLPLATSSPRINASVFCRASSSVN